MSRIRHDRIRLYMIKADSFCVRGSVEYPVKMELGSFRTMTVLFIMILPEQEMGLKKLVEHQCGIPGTGAKYFFYIRIKHIVLNKKKMYFCAGRSNTF